MSEVTYIKWKNMDAVQLENNWIRSVVLPELGGKIVSVKYKKNDFELAAQCESQAYGRPEFGSDFSTFDASGLDDAFPNIDEADVRWEDRKWFYPDHGEIWSSRFACEVEEERVILTYTSPEFPYTYRKEISLKNSQMVLRYEIRNLTEMPFPCLWTFHGLVRYEEDMRLLYEEGTDSFENVLESPELGKKGRHIPFHNSEYDFSRVPPKKSRTMIKYYADKKQTAGKCGWQYPGQNMECLLEYDADRLPYLGVWITAGGFRGDYNMALEPSNGYYDDVRTAEKNNSLYMLKKEEPLQFEIKISMHELGES